MNVRGSIRDKRVINIFANGILGRDSIDYVFCWNKITGLNADIVILGCKFIVRLTSNNIDIKVDVNTDAIDEFDVADGNKVTKDYI